MKLVQLLSFIFGICCFTTLESAAAAVHSRKAQATIQNVDGATRTLTSCVAKTVTIRKNLFGTEVYMFVHGSIIVAARDLVQGMHCTVYYKVPFFGKPFLTKIVW